MSGKLIMEEAFEMLREMQERGQEFAEQQTPKLRLRGFTDAEGALELAKRGFVIVGNLQDKPRTLSLEEIEYLVAKGKGNVQ